MARVQTPTFPKGPRCLILCKLQMWGCRRAITTLRSQTILIGVVHMVDATPKTLASQVLDSNLAVLSELITQCQRRTLRFVRQASKFQENNQMPGICLMNFSQSEALDYSQCQQTSQRLLLRAKVSSELPSHSHCNRTLSKISVSR